jgi:hypothetical protein
MNLLEALDHSELFGPFFVGDSWRAWRAFLAALFALPMDTAQRATYQHHTGRTEVPTAPFKEAALVVGRRGGKSRVLALVAVFLACFNSYERYLAPGEVATIGVIAADRKQARTIFRFIIGLLRAVPPLAEMIEDETAETIALTNRVSIEIHTASFRVTRGYTFAAVLADETAFWRDENSANPDSEIFRALRPGLSSIPGAMLLNASSPYRKTGVLYSTYRRHFGKDGARRSSRAAHAIRGRPSPARSCERGRASRARSTPRGSGARRRAGAPRGPGVGGVPARAMSQHRPTCDTSATWRTRFTVISVT